MHRREFIQGSALVTAASLASPVLAKGAAEVVPVTVDTRSVTGPLRHIWSESAGSDRAAMTLRESWRRDLDRWVAECGLKRVRCHGILNDELGVFAPSILNRGKAEPNFRNVFQVYDGFIEHGVAPLVELSFMPSALASGKAQFGFYGGNITPPKSLDAWSQFITKFVAALANRYGIDKIRSWNFEVWNEPDLAFFWTGKKQDYFDLYKATAIAIKQVDKQIPVGGPATSGGKWIDDFTAFCDTANAPLDFIATHAYAGDKQTVAEGRAPISVNDVVPEAMRNVRRILDASRFKGLPVWLTEWSSDSPAMIAHVVNECLPLLRGMSHWVLSGAYEELGVANYVLKEGDMGWATMVEGIARPSFNTYKLLHRLGDERLQADGPAIASRNRQGKMSAVVWNLAEAKQPAGIPGSTSERIVTGTAKRLEVSFKGARPGSRAQVWFVDQERGSPMPAWRRMGSPQYPTQAQLQTLRAAAEIAAPVTVRLDRNASLSLDLPPEGIALIELG